jgi:hypothetical protein
VAVAAMAVAVVVATSSVFEEACLVGNLFLLLLFDKNSNKGEPLLTITLPYPSCRRSSTAMIICGDAFL